MRFVSLKSVGGAISGVAQRPLGTSVGMANALSINIEALPPEDRFFAMLDPARSTPNLRLGVAAAGDAQFDLLSPGDVFVIRGGAKYLKIFDVHSAIFGFDAGNIRAGALAIGSEAEYGSVINRRKRPEPIPPYNIIAMVQTDAINKNFGFPFSTLNLEGLRVSVWPLDNVGGRPIAMPADFAAVLRPVVVPPARLFTGAAGGAAVGWNADQIWPNPGGGVVTPEIDPLNPDSAAGWYGTAVELQASPGYSRQGLNQLQDLTATANQNVWDFPIAVGTMAMNFKLISFGGTGVSRVGLLVEGR